MIWPQGGSSSAYNSLDDAPDCYVLECAYSDDQSPIKNMRTSSRRLIKQTHAHMENTTPWPQTPSVT